MYEQLITQPSHLNAARFPVAIELQLREACRVLGVGKTELIVAGTQAEIERRMRELRRSQAAKMEPATQA